MQGTYLAGEDPGGKAFAKFTHEDMHRAVEVRVVTLGPSFLNIVQYRSRRREESVLSNVR